MGGGAVARGRGACARSAWAAQHLRDVSIDRGAIAQFDRAGGAARPRRLSSRKILGAGDLHHAALCGPVLALRLFTRLAACPIVIFLVVSNYERWRGGGYFWNKKGLEYTLLWTGAPVDF